MNQTNIEWAKNPDGTPGFTWNPITGCCFHDGAGNCLGGRFPCYAYKLAHGRLKTRYLANKRIAGSNPYEGVPYIPAKLRMEGEDPFYPRFWPEKLEGQICRENSPEHGIFVCSMSDLFGLGVPEEWIRKILLTIKTNPQNRYYILTKQPKRMMKFNPFPENVFLGITSTGSFSATADAIIYLKHSQAKKKFISFEPLLFENGVESLGRKISEAGINWIIIGGQTGPAKMPKPEWLVEIVEAADQAGAKIFLKNNLKPLVEKHFIETHDPLLVAGYQGHPENNYFNIDMRQEMPE